MVKLALLFSVFFFNIVHSAFEDHFKKISDKSGSHQIRNIDFIYMINLDERPEKYQLSLQQLTPYNISPCRFSAVNGWQLSIETINAVGTPYAFWMRQGLWGTFYSLQNNGDPSHEVMQSEGRVYFCHCLSHGAIGIALSHLSVLQDAYDSGYETIWVMEDDIEVIRDPNTLSSLIDELDSLVGEKNWDILFTDQDMKGQKGEYIPCFSYAPRPNFSPCNPGRFAERHNISSNFRKIGARYGAHSMVIRRSGIKKILNFLKDYRIFLPFDMEYTLPDDIHLFTVTHDVVSVLPTAISDNGAPYYLRPIQ